MALIFSFNSAVYTDSGTPLSSAYARLKTFLFNDEETVQIQIELYESELAYNDRRRRIWIDQIPTLIKVIMGTLSSNNYKNLNMTAMHNQVKGILLEGYNHNNYPDYADPSWPGLEGVDVFNTITIDMPT